MLFSVLLSALIVTLFIERLSKEKKRKKKKRERERDNKVDL